AGDTPKAKATPKQKDDSQSMVVFAFRLTRAERDLIHKTAGSAKASKFIRGIALAAARGDIKAVEQVINEVQKSDQ
ncbi:hypothetical protein KAR91_64190, partial [Candidatus Pacearchaeota archaeon]|nr:hypothetical protein [Candidatus Pacearchaeota archaeon]